MALPVRCVRALPGWVSTDWQKVNLNQFPYGPASLAAPPPPSFFSHDGQTCRKLNNCSTRGNLGPLHKTHNEKRWTLGYCRPPPSSPLYHRVEPHPCHLIVTKTRQTVKIRPETFLIKIEQGRGHESTVFHVVDVRYEV